MCGGPPEPESGTAGIYVGAVQRLCWPQLPPATPKSGHGLEWGSAVIAGTPVLTLVQRVLGFLPHRGLLGPPGLSKTPFPAGSRVGRPLAETGRDSDQVGPAKAGEGKGGLCKETPPEAHTTRGLFKEERSARPLSAECPLTPSLASCQAQRAESSPNASHSPGRHWKRPQSLDTAIQKGQQKAEG